jgi:hypothetical protein
MTLKTIVNSDNLKIAGKILGLYGASMAVGLALAGVASKVYDWVDNKKEKKTENKKEDELRTCNMGPSATNEDSNDYEVDFRFFNTY